MLTPDLGELKALRDKMLVAIDAANTRLAAAHFSENAERVAHFRSRSNQINNELGRLLADIAELEPDEDDPNADPEPAPV